MGTNKRPWRKLPAWRSHGLGSGPRREQRSVVANLRPEAWHPRCARLSLPTVLGQVGCHGKFRLCSRRARAQVTQSWGAPSSGAATCGRVSTRGLRGRPRAMRRRVEVYLPLPRHARTQARARGYATSEFTVHASAGSRTLFLRCARPWRRSARCGNGTIARSDADQLSLLLPLPARARAPRATAAHAPQPPDSRQGRRPARPRAGYGRCVTRRRRDPARPSTTCALRRARPAARASSTGRSSPPHPKRG